MRVQLGQLLSPISLRLRQRLELTCLEAPLSELFEVLADRQGAPAVRQLAALLLARRSELDGWAEQLLRCLDEEEERQVLQGLANCIASLADLMARKGEVWTQLLFWMRSIEAVPRRRWAFLYLLERLLESTAWRELLAPHVLELSDFLYRLALSESAYSRAALECIGSLATAVRGEDAARLFHHQVVRPLVAQAVGPLCDGVLEALGRAAAADELLIADSSFYTDLAPEQLCPVVRLALEASRERRDLALRLLYSVADSHSRLLCTSRQGRLSAEEVLEVLLRLCLEDAEAACAVLARMAKRMPDKLVLPVVYRACCRAMADGPAPVRLAAFTALRAVLGCTTLVKRQLPRIARLVLRGLTDARLRAATFPLIADLCHLVPPEVRCGSCRLAERLLPPLLQQVQELHLTDAAFLNALAALEAACPKHGRLPVSNLVAWTVQKLEELLAQGSVEASEAICTRLVALLVILLPRLDREKPLEARCGQVLRQILLCGCIDSRSMALEAINGLKSPSDELQNLALNMARQGLQGDPRAGR